MESEKQDNKHGLGLDLLSTKPASTSNPSFRHEKPNYLTEQTAQHIVHDPSEKPAKRKGGRNAAKAVGGLGLKHLESSWENAESRLRSRKSIASPITQRKKSARRTKSGRKVGTPRIKVDTDIQVQQTSVPLQVFPTPMDNPVSHIIGQQSRDTEFQKDSRSNLQNRLSAVTSNTPRGKISWWLKGTAQLREGSSAATASPSPLSTLRLAGISPSDGPIPIGIDQDTLVSLNTQRSSYRSNPTEATPTIMITPAREAMISKWSPSSPGSTAVPASMARASSIYSSMNGLCQPDATRGSAPPVPALPSNIIHSNVFNQSTRTVNYATQGSVTSDPFTAPPQPVKRRQTDESDNTIIEEDETPPADNIDKTLELKQLPQKPQPAAFIDARSRPDLTIETTIPTPRRSRGWWNVITTPFEFLGSGAKDRRSIPAWPFTNITKDVSTTHWTPDSKELDTATDSTFPSPTATVSSLDKRSNSRMPIAHGNSSPPKEYNRAGLAPYESPGMTKVPPYQRIISNFSHQQQDHKAIEPVTVNVTHIDQRTYNSYGNETRDSEQSSFVTSSPRERRLKTTTNMREYITTEETSWREGFPTHNQVDRTFESPRTVPAPQTGLVNSRDRSVDRSRERYREKSKDDFRGASKERYRERSRDKSSDRTRDRFESWSIDRSRNESGDRSSQAYNEKQYGRNHHDDSAASKKYSVKVSGNPRGLFPFTGSSHRSSTLPYSHGSRGGPVAGMPVSTAAPTATSFGQSLRSWFPRNLSPRKKPGQCIVFSVLVGLIIILIAILVPVMTINRDDGGDGGENSPDALWFNVTGFPAMPSGITTVAKTNAVVQKSGCVFPTTLWSCALPKEKQSSDDSFEPDEPTFRIEIGSLNDRNPDNVESLPPPPTLEDQMFLGNTTDKKEEPFEGEEAPFLISLLPPDGDNIPERKVKRQILGGNDDDDDDDGDNDDDKDNDKDTDGDTPDLQAIIPSPSIGRDGKAAPANLLAFPKEQRLRLYNRGLDDEHYGFYIYYDRSIFLQSVSALNGSDADRVAQDEEDRDGGATLEDASVRCTWAQTRLLVQIWTRREGKRLLPGNDDGNKDGKNEDNGDKDGETSSTPESLIESGIFPYPITLMLDRHGGSIEDKMIYCYGVDDEGEIIATQRKFQLESRGFEGQLVNPAQGPFGNVTVDMDDGGPGGIDGGSGGCSCKYENWVEED